MEQIYEYNAKCMTFESERGISSEEKTFTLKEDFRHALQNTSCCCEYKGRRNMIKAMFHITGTERVSLYSDFPNIFKILIACLNGIILRLSLNTA